jgi:hypothetical protein
MFGRKRDVLSIVTHGPGDPESPGPKPAVKGAEHEIRRRVAVVVVHGMGQQVPYETLGLLAECLTDLEGTPTPRAVIDRVQLTPDGAPLSRVEVTLPRADVHVYEGYWAPLTAGKVGLWDTISFLLSGFIAGVWSRIRGGQFKRWMFDKMQELPIKPGTVLSLVIALSALVLLSLPALWALSQWNDIQKDGFWTYLSAHSFVFALALVLLGLYALGLWYVLVEFVGDVALYVSAHTVSRFEETRTAIQQVVVTVLRQVYLAQRNGKPEYDRVVLVGHSLGTVVAYDALNASIAWDRDEQGGVHHVVERTRRFITFGSPLDKTAYLFRTQVSGQHYLREALAALRQPLILSYAKFRPREFRWVNIYSRADVVSGPLTYYDAPLAQGKPPDPHRNPVINVVDYQAWIPFYAHVQYWNNTKLREELREAVDA